MIAFSLPFGLGRVPFCCLTGCRLTRLRAFYVVWDLGRFLVQVRVLESGTFRFGL